MSNRSREQRAHIRRPTPKVSAAEQLRTLDLYFALNSSSRASEKLGISAAAVRDRLYALGVELIPRGYRRVSAADCNDPDVIRELRVRLIAEARVDQRKPVGVSS